MPKRIAETKQTHPAYDNLSVYVAETGYKKTWYADIYLGNKKSKLKSLRLPYDPEDAHAYLKAFDAALPIYFDVTKRQEQGFTVTRQSFGKVAERFAAAIKKQAEENEERIAAGMRPIHESFGRRSFWKMEHYEHIDWVISQIILPFFQQNEYANKAIEGITEKEIEAWQFWRISKRAKELRKNWSAGTLNKQNRVLRQIFQYAKTEKMIASIPDIQDAKESLRDSRRPELTSEQYEKLLDYIRSKYQDEDEPDGLRIYRRLFYLWLVTIDATAMRPWKSEKNALKWSDITREFNDDGTVKSILIKRVEKGIAYTAIADKHWSSIYDDIKAIHKAWGMKSDYLFAHPITNEVLKRVKDAPIQNFRTQWNNAMGHFGWAKKYAKQQERISPYSLRHRYFHRRMLENKDIRIEELAQITGTSVRVITESYWHFDAERRYEDFTAGGYEQNMNKVRLYDSMGILMGFADRNSDEHREWYKRNPNTEKPTK